MSRTILITGVVRARRLQRRHHWPGTRVRPRAHEAPRLGAPSMKAIRIHRIPTSFSKRLAVKRRNAPGPS